MKNIQWIKSPVSKDGAALTFVKNFKFSKLVALLQIVVGVNICRF